MTYYDENLKKLQEQTARKKHLEAVLDDLGSQQEELLHKVFELKEAMLDEQEDVERLEGRSLASFFYNVVGKMDEKLDKERQEAYAAAVKYDAAACELEMVKADIERYKAEQQGLRGCEERYKEALQSKITKIKLAGIAGAQEILQCEERLGYLENQKREIREAMTAGRSALSVMENVMSSLNSAEGYGTWDLLGGGLIADIAKHSHLDEAQNQIERLQMALRGFKTELADIKIDAELQVNIDGFLHFADFFFDGLFADWAVMDKITTAKKQVESKRRYIEQTHDKLVDMLETIEKEQELVKEKLGNLAVNTEI